MFQEQAEIIHSLKQQVQQLKREGRFNGPDRQRLRSIIHSAAEIIHGGPVESVTLNSQ